MIGFILFMLGAPIQPGYVHSDPCEKSPEHLSAEKQVDFAIGCSSVRGSRLFTNKKIRRILKDE